MALMTMEREPEVARFIDTYKFDQDMATRRDRYGGGTSLPLNSDGYEDKQKVLRDERHKDWLQQQDKPRSRDAVYYRVGTPEEGFAGLGNYEKQRQEINMVRQKEYNDMLKKQRQMEQQKLDARRHRSPPRPAQPLGPQIDYNAASENARAEERRAYQDYMKAKEERYWAMRGRPVTPPGGLNIGNYDRQVKETAAAKKKEYKEMLDQQKNEQLTLRAMDRVADVSTKYVKYRDQERPLVGSPRDINYNLREQQREHMYLRARQEPEISILDRNGPSSNFLANKPPPGPGFSRARDEAFKNESQSRPIPERPVYGQPPYPGEGPHQNDPEGRMPYLEPQERSRSPGTKLPRSPEKPLDPDWLRVPLRDDERPAELGTPLADERRRQEDVRHQQQQMSKPTEIVKNPFYSSDDYEKFQREIQRKQGEEYREFLSKQRVSNPSRRHEFVDTASGPYGGLFHGLGEHGNRTEVLNRERHQEYNEKLDQQFGKDRPSGRPNWVKESLPNDVDRGRSPMRNQPDQYQQILDEKRREEASRRRYEDPEYQGRLAQGRDRGEAGQRYGY